MRDKWIIEVTIGLIFVFDGALLILLIVGVLGMGLHADSLTPIALRMRDGEWEYPGGIEEPDLSGYDRFITGTDDGGEER